MPSYYPDHRVSVNGGFPCSLARDEDGTAGLTSRCDRSVSLYSPVSPAYLPLTPG